MFFKRLLAGLLAATFGMAMAQDFPSKAVKLVNPYPPGGPIDTFARAMAVKLAEKWKQPVVVENRPGASEMIGAQSVATSAPDGHTILLSTEQALTLNPYLYKKMPLDPFNDLAPVTQILNVPYAFLVPSDSPVRTLGDFVQRAKANPGKTTFATGGVLGVTQFAFVDLASAENLDVLVVPFSGLGTVLPELLAGRVDSTFGGIAPITQHVASGKLRALAVGGGTRSKALPDVPTFRELGYKDVNAGFFLGVTVAAKTLPAVISKIAEDMRQVASDKAFREQNIDPFGLEVVASTPQEFGNFLQANRAVQQARVRKSGVQMQ
jgi:tripartite-type tricarboxylate transporter receptor subunit TctC